MTIENQIRTIQALGYSQPEAQFLRLVALHSGYFVRRQFLRYMGAQRGKRAQDFIDELIGRGHACREVFRGDRHLFRLQSKVIYEALGEQDNRNRREHQPSTVRLRLMGLDFILEHPGYRYLMTQEEKLSYLFDQRGIDPQKLPARFFRSNGTVTTRYFPDGFPQFVDDASPPAISFVYVDDAQLSADTFRCYLGNCRNLFEALGTVNLIFVTTAPDRFVIGQKALARFWTRARESAAPTFDLNRLLTHFPHRLLVEKRETGILNGAQMRALAEDIHTLCGPHFDHLYDVWKQSGDDGLRAEHMAQSEALNPPQINLSSCVLEYDYDLFGTLHDAS
jgi:hypothetical protein